jgi:hypothetical protein
MQWLNSMRQMGPGTKEAVKDITEAKVIAGQIGYPGAY